MSFCWTLPFHALSPRLKAGPELIPIHQVLIRLPVQALRIRGARKRRAPAAFLPKRRRRCNIAPRFRFCIGKVDARTLRLRLWPLLNPLQVQRLTAWIAFRCWAGLCANKTNPYLGRLRSEERRVG